MKLPPFLMQPAWRYDSQTPWGGENLKNKYGKASPGPRAGESLELSAIPGLESSTTDGQTLSQLTHRYGNQLMGSQVSLPFPLLIKLIDAKEDLSVQVHPDDAYAQVHHGKLGKNEAWAILDAKPGAQLIIGLQEGLSLPQLRQAALQGREIEGLMRKIAVQPGQVYYIPAGTVHAIGAGLTLYEIQQSSDVTYRLYDWDRRDKDGKGRELHLDHSLAVTQLDSRPEPAQAVLVHEDETGRLERLLDTPYFVLDRLSDCQGLMIQPDIQRFSALTALQAMQIAWEAGRLDLQQGQTALLPADGYPLRLTGKLALLAAPEIP